MRIDGRGSLGTSFVCMDCGHLNSAPCVGVPSGLLFCIFYFVFGFFDPGFIVLGNENN